MSTGLAVGGGLLGGLLIGGTAYLMLIASLASLNDHN